MSVYRLSIPHLIAIVAALGLSLAGSTVLAAEPVPAAQIGVAQIDITPEYPCGCMAMATERRNPRGWPAAESGGPGDRRGPRRGPRGALERRFRFRPRGSSH